MPSVPGRLYSRPAALIGVSVSRKLASPPWLPSVYVAAQKNGAALRRRGHVRMVSSSRKIHSSNRVSRPSNQLLLETPPGTMMPSEPPHMAESSEPSPLSVLPLTNVIRSLATTTISSSPVLLPPSLAIMSALANSTNPLLNPDRNPLLRSFLKKTFYAQYCAGENAREVQQSMDRLKRIGFTGVILGYAREVVLTEAQTRDLAGCKDGAAAEECVRDEVIPWATGTMETVGLAQPGDFVAIKFTGAGRQALYSLKERLPPPPVLAAAIDSICSLAASRRVRLLFDAEQTALQPGIDAWTLDYMRRYNAPASSPSGALIYGTYQAYLLSTPSTLSAHLAAARDGGFALGVKLVRGAYLGSDPRYLMHPTKDGTDAAYDGVARALLRGEWSGPLVDPSSAAAAAAAAFPEVSLLLATHNAESVRKARELRAAQQLADQDFAGLRPSTPQRRMTELSYAQLQGMADEVSCTLVAPGSSSSTLAEQAAVTTRPKAYKYLVWGTTGECMKYLLRRAQENRDAVQRTLSGREAMRGEVLRRVKTLFGAA